MGNEKQLKAKAVAKNREYKGEREGDHEPASSSPIEGDSVGGVQCTITEEIRKGEITPRATGKGQDFLARLLGALLDKADLSS